MGNFLKWVWNAISNVAQAWQLWTWLATTAWFSAMTSYMAQVSGIDGYNVVLVGLGAFCLVSLGWAGVFHALLRQNEWRHRTQIEGKFDYVSPYFGVDVKWDENGKPLYIESMNIGIVTINRAFEAIQFRVNTFHALIEGRGPNTDRYVGKIMSTPSQVGGHSHPEPVFIGDLRKLEVKGTIEFDLSYGAHGKFLYSIKKKQEFYFVVNKENSVKPNPALSFAVRDRD
jgi:hypothetical protein